MINYLPDSVKQQIREAVAADSALRTHLAGVVTNFKNNNPETTAVNSGFARLAHDAFIELNAIAAKALNRQADFRKEAAIVESSLTRQSTANPRSTYENELIGDFQGCAEFMYSLVENDRAKASLEANDMWRAAKNYYSNYWQF